MQTVDLLLKGQTVDENGNFIVRQQPTKTNTGNVENGLNNEAVAIDPDFARRNKKIIKPITKEEVESLLKEKVGPYSEYEIQRIVELQRYFDGFAYTPKSSEGGRLADDGTDPLYLYQSNMATIGRILDTQVEEDAYWISLRKEERRERRMQEATKKSTNAAAELAAKRRSKIEKKLSPPVSPHSDESTPIPTPKIKSKKNKELFAEKSATRQFPPGKVDDFVHRGDAEPDDDIDVVGGGEVESFSSDSDEDDGSGGGDGSHNFYSGGDSDENSDMFPQDNSGDSDGGPIRKKVKCPTARHRLLMDDNAREHNGSRRYRARLARLRDDVLNASKVAIEKDAYSKLLAMTRSIGPELRGNRPPIHTFLAVLKPHMDKTIGSQNPTNVPTAKGLRNVTSAAASAAGGKKVEEAEPVMEYYSEPFVAQAPKISKSASSKRLSSIYGSDSRENASDTTADLKSTLPVCVDEPEPLVFGYGTKNMQIRMLTAMLKFRKDQTNALKRVVRQLADQLIFTDRDIKERLQKSAAADAEKVDQLETRIDELLREQNYIYHKMYGSSGHLAAQVLLQEQAAAEEQSKTMDAAFGRGAGGGGGVFGETPDASSPITTAPKELLLANGDTPSKTMLAEAQRVARAKKYRKDVDDAYRKLRDTEVAKAVVRAKGTSEQIDNSLRRLEAEIAEQKIITLNATLHSCKTIVCRNRAMKANRSLERELMERHDLQTIHSTAKVSNALVNAFSKDAQTLFTNVTPQSHGDAHGHLRDLPGCVTTGESGTTTAIARKKSLVTGAPPTGKSPSRYANTAAAHNNEAPPPLYHFEKPTTRIRVVDVAETLVKDMIPYIQASARTIVSKIAAHKPSGNGTPYMSPMFGTEQMQPGEVLQHYINHSKARRDESLIDKFYQPSEVFRHERTAYFLRHMSAATDMVRRTLCTMTTMILTTASACGGHGGGGIYIPSCGIYRYPFPKRSGSLSSQDVAARDAVLAMGSSRSASFSAASASPLVTRNTSVSQGGFAEANNNNNNATLTPAQQRALKLYPQMAAKLTPSAQRKNRITTSGVEIVQPTFRGDNVYYVYQVAQHLHANGVLQHMCDTLFVQYMQTLENVPFTDPYGLASKTSFIVESSRPPPQNHNNLNASASLLGGPPRKPPTGPGGKKATGKNQGGGGGAGASTSLAGGVSPLEFNVVPEDAFLYDADASAFGNSSKALSYSNMRRDSYQTDPSVVLGSTYQSNAIPAEANFMGAADVSSPPRGNNSTTSPQRGTSGGGKSPRRGKTTPKQGSKRSPKRGKGSGGGKRSPVDEGLPDLSIDAAHLVDSPRGQQTTLSLTPINFNQSREDGNYDDAMLSSRSIQSELITAQMVDSPLMTRPSSREAIPTERTAVRAAAAPSSFRNGTSTTPIHVVPPQTETITVIDENGVKQQVQQVTATPTSTNDDGGATTTVMVSSSNASNDHHVADVFVADAGMQTELTSEALERLVANIHQHRALTPTSSRRQIHSSHSNLSHRSAASMSPTSRQNHREMLSATMGDGFVGGAARHSSSSSVVHGGRGGYQVINSDGERTPTDDFAATVAMERDDMLLLSASGSCTPIAMSNHSLTSDHRAATRTHSKARSIIPAVETISTGTDTSPPETRSVASQAFLAKQEDRLDVESLSVSYLSAPALSSPNTAGLDELRGDTHVLASESVNVQNVINSGLLAGSRNTSTTTGAPMQVAMLVRSMLSQLSPGYLYYCLPTYEINSALRQLSPSSSSTRRHNETKSIAHRNPTTPSEVLNKFVVTVCIRSFASLWNFSPTGTAQAMSLLRTLLRSEVASYSGAEIKCEQDMFLASFPTAVASMSFVDTVQVGAMRLPYHAYQSSYNLLKNHPAMSEVPYSVLHTIPTDMHSSNSSSTTDSALTHLSRPVYQLETEEVGTAATAGGSQSSSWLFEAVLAGFRSSIGAAKTSSGSTTQVPLSPTSVTQTMCHRQQSVQHIFDTLFKHLNVTPVATTSGNKEGGMEGSKEGGGGPVSNNSFISMNVTPMEELLNAVSPTPLTTSTSHHVYDNDHNDDDSNLGYFIQRGLPLVFGIGTSVEESLAAACDGIRTSYHSTTPFTVPSPSTVAQGVNGDADTDGCFFFTMPTGASVVSTVSVPEIKPTSASGGGPSTMSHSSEDFDLCSLSLRDAEEDSGVFKTVTGSGATTNGTPLTIFGALVVASYCHAEAMSTRTIVDGVVTHIQKTPSASGAGTTSTPETTAASDAQKGLPATKQGQALQSIFSEVRKNAAGYSLASEKHLSALGYHVSMGVCCSIAFSKRYEEECTTSSSTHHLQQNPLSVRNISGQTQEIITLVSRKRWEFVYASEVSLLVSSRKWESLLNPMNKSISNVLTTTARLIFTSCPKLLFDRYSDMLKSGDGGGLSPRLLDGNGFVSDKERRVALIAQGKQTVPIVVEEAISAALNGRSSSLHTLILSAVTKVPALRRGVQLYEKLLSSCGMHPLQLLALESSSPVDLAAYGPIMTPKYPWSVSEVIESSIRKLHLSSSSTAVSAIQEYRVTNSIIAADSRQLNKNLERYAEHGGEMHDSTSSFTIEVNTTSPDGTSISIPSSNHTITNTPAVTSNTNNKQPDGKRLTFVVVEIEDADAVLQEALGQEIIEASHFGDMNFAGTGVDELSIAPSPTPTTTTSTAATPRSHRSHHKKAKSTGPTSDAIVTVSYDSSRVHQAFYDHFEPHIYPPMLTHGRSGGNNNSGAPTDQLQQRLNEKGRSLRHQLNASSASIVKGIEQVALGTHNINTQSTNKPSLLQIGGGDLGGSTTATPTVYKCLNVEHFQQLCASVQRVSDKVRIAQAVAAIDSDGPNGGGGPFSSKQQQQSTTPSPPAKRVVMFAFENPVDALAVACEAHHIALNALYTPDVLSKIPSCGAKFSSPAAAAANARLARGGSAAADGGGTTIADEGVDAFDNNNNRGGGVTGEGVGSLEGVLWKGLKVRAAVAMATPSLEVVESNGGVYAYGEQVTFAMDLLYGAKFGETIVSEEVRQTVTDVSAAPSVKCTYLEQHQRATSRDNSAGGGGPPNHHRTNNASVGGGYSWWMVPSSVKYTFSTTSDRTLDLDQVLSQPSSQSSPKVHTINTSPDIMTAYVCLAKGLTARWHLLERAHRQEEFEVKKLACMEKTESNTSTVWMSCTPYHRQMYVGSVPLSILQIAQLTATSGTNVGLAATSTLADEESDVPLSKCLSQSVLAMQAAHGIPLTNHRESFSHLARVGYAGTSSSVLSLLCFVKAHPLLLASALRDESTSVLASLERRMTKLLVEQDRERNDVHSSRSSNYHSDGGSSSPGKASKRQFNDAATSQQAVYTKNFEFLTSVVEGLKIECRSNILFTLREAVLGATCITLGSLFESPSSLHDVIAAACLKVQLALRTALVGNVSTSTTAGGGDHSTMGSSSNPGAKRTSLGGGGGNGESVYSGPNLSSHPDFYPTSLPTTVSGDFSYVLQQYCGVATTSQKRDDVVYVPFSPSDIERGLIGSWMTQSLKDVASQGVSPRRELKAHSGASLLLYEIAQLRPERRQSALQELLPLYINCLSESSIRSLMCNTMYFGDADEEYARWCIVLEHQFASTEDPSLSQQQHKPTATLDELIRQDPEALQDHQDFVLSRYDTTAAGVSRIGILGQKEHQQQHQSQENTVGLSTSQDPTGSATFASWPRKQLKQSQLRDRQSTRYPGLSKRERLRERLDFNQHQQTISSSTTTSDTSNTTTTTAAVSTVHMWNEVFTAAVIHHLGSNPELKKIINKEIVKQQSKYSLTRTASSGRVLGDGPRQLFTTTATNTANPSSSPASSSSSYRLPLLVVLQPIVEALVYQANELNAAIRLVVDRAAVQCDGIVRTPHQNTTTSVDDKDLTTIGAWIEYIIATYENSMWESTSTNSQDQPHPLTPASSPEQQQQARREMLGVNPPPPPPTFQVEFPDALKALHYSHQLKVALNRLPIVLAARRKTMGAHTDVSILSNPSASSVFTRTRNTNNMPLSSSFLSGSGRNMGGGGRRNQGAGCTSAQQAILHHKCLSIPIDSLMQCFGEHRGEKGNVVFIGPRVVTAMATSPFNDVVGSIQFTASRNQLRFSCDADVSDAEALEVVKRRDMVAKNIYQRSLQMSSPTATTQSHDGDQYLRIAAASTEQAVGDAIDLLMQVCSNNQVAGGETAIHTSTHAALRNHPLLRQSSDNLHLLHIPYLLQPFVFFQRRPLPNTSATFRSTTINNILHDDEETQANTYILMVPKMFESRPKFNDGMLSIAEEHTLTDTKEEPASPMKSQQSVMFVEESSSSAALTAATTCATNDENSSNVMNGNGDHDPISAALRSIREEGQYIAKNLSVYAKTVRCRASCIAVMRHASSSSSSVTASQLSEVVDTLLSPLISFISVYYGNTNRTAAIPAINDRHTLVQHVHNTMVRVLSMSMMVLVTTPHPSPSTTSTTSGGAQLTTLTTTNNCEAYQYDARRLLSEESAKSIHAVREVMKALIAGPNQQHGNSNSTISDVTLMTMVGDTFVCETDIARAVELAEEVMQARSRPTTTDVVLLNMGGRPQKQQNWESFVVQNVVNRTQQKPPPLSSLTHDRPSRRSNVVSFFVDGNSTAPTSTTGGGPASSPTPDEAIASAIANPTSVMSAITSVMSSPVSFHRIANHSAVTPSGRGGVGSFAFTPTPGGARGNTASALARSFGRSAERGLSSSVNAGSTQPPVVTPMDISICTEVQKHFRQLCAISTKAAKVMGYPQSTITTTTDGPNKVDGVLRSAIKTFNQSASATTTIDHTQLRGTLNVSMQDVQRASRGLLEDIMTALNCRAERPSRFHRSQQTLIAIPANNEATQVSDESSDDDSLVGGGRGRRGLKRSNTMISFKGSTSSAAFGMTHTDSNLSSIPRRRSASRRQSVLETTSYSDNINARLFKKLKHIASGADAVYNVGIDGKVAMNSKGDPKKGYSLGSGPSDGNNKHSNGDGGGSGSGGEMVIRSKEYRPGGGHDILSVQLRERMIIELEEELESLRAGAAIRHQQYPGDDDFDDDEFDVKDDNYRNKSSSSTPTQTTTANPHQLITLPSLASKSSAGGESSSSVPAGGAAPPSTSSFKTPDYMGMLTAFNRPPLGGGGARGGMLHKSGTADGSTQRSGRKKVGGGASSLPQNRASTTGQQQSAQNLRLLPPLSSSATPTAGGDWVSLHQDGASNRNSPVDLLATRNISPIPHQQQLLSTSTTSAAGGGGGQLVPHQQQRSGNISPIPLLPMPSGDLSSAFVVATINPTQDIRGDLHAPFSRHYNLQQRGVTPGVIAGGRGGGGVAQHRVTRRNLSPMRNMVQKNTPARAPETATHINNSSGAVPLSRHRQASDPDIEGV